MLAEKSNILSYRHMYQVKSLLFKMVASMFVVASLYACNSVEDKKEANEEV